MLRGKKSFAKYVGSFPPMKFLRLMNPPHIRGTLQFDRNWLFWFPANSTNSTGPWAMKGSTPKRDARSQCTGSVCRVTGGCKRRSSIRSAFIALSSAYSRLSWRSFMSRNWLLGSVSILGRKLCVKGTFAAPIPILTRRIRSL